MNAKEMFEGLGYKYQKTTNQIKYRCTFNTITFNLNAKTMQRNYRVYDISLLQAIYKQCQELEWLDEE